MRPLGANTQVAVDSTVTTPTYLVELGFDSVIRLSTRGEVNYDGELWLDASMDLSLGASPSLQVFNEQTQLGQIVLTEGTAGRSARVFQYYDDAEVILRFDGEMGESEIRERISIDMKHRPPNRTPRDYVNEPTFSHLPAPGTRIETLKQIVVLS